MTPADLITQDESGRMVPVDRDALTRAVVAQLRQAAVGFIALGDHQEAIGLLTKALARCDDTRAIDVHLNLGDAHRYAGDLLAAQPHYEQAHRLAEAHAPHMVSLCLQHKGKRRWSQGRTAEAKDLLERALELRSAHGDPELIESTKAALRSADPLWTDAP